jgi:GNAT superfamily N-acetyltransferase
MSLRRYGGNALTFARDHVFGASSSIVFEAPCDPATGACLSPPIRFRFGSARDVASFTKESHDYDPAAQRFGLERLERGDSLIVGESGREVVFYAWFMLGQIDADLNLYLPMASEAAYSYRVFTVRHARGQGICGAYYEYLKQLLREKNCRRLVCRIRPGNTASIRAHARAAFREQGRLWRLAIPGRAFIYADRALRMWLPTMISDEYFSARGFLRITPALRDIERVA